VDALEAFQNNWIGFFEMLPHYRPAARFCRSDGLIVGMSGLPIATFNSVIVLDPGVLTLAHLANYAEIFKREDLPFCIQVCSRDPVAACNTLMLENNYTDLFLDPIMICEGPLLSPRLNPRVMIRPVESLADRECYEQIVGEVFSLPAGLSEFFEMFWTIPGCLQLLALIDGEAMGTGMLLCANGSAAIYNVATLYEMRGQGIGSTIIHALHNAALDQGYEGTVLAASPSSHSLYQRLGYRLDGYQTSFMLPGLG
jgi:GNAT superfamily N-acetyltransferase